MQSHVRWIEKGRWCCAMAASRAGVALALTLALASGVAQAAPGMITVPGGSLIVNGTLANADVTVSGSGTLGGEGTILGGAVTLAATGIVAPGIPAAAGELDSDALTWQAGGAMAFQLGANDAASDHLAFVGSLTKQGSGAFQFAFGDGATPPTPGATYTLLSFAGQTGFTASDFSYTYAGSQAALNGQFQLTPTALLFTVISTPVELQSFDVN